MNLKNATVLITGGSAGIGRDIAAALAGAGARVAITGRDEQKLSAAAASLGAHPIRADVASEADVIRTYQEFMGTFGHLDVLVNNAGVGAFPSLVDTDRGQFEAVFATNVTGAMLMAREAAKHFISRNRGKTECWRAELRPHNVRVFLVNPSEVITDFAATAGLSQKDNPTKLHGEDIAHIVKAMLEMDDRGFTPELSVFATNPKD